MQNQSALRRELVQICRRLHDRGLTAGTDGNVSVRTPNNTILVTPTCVAKSDVAATAIVEVNLSGGVMGNGVPSSELPMHLAIFRDCPDVRAVVHAHPPTATALAVVGRGIAGDVLPEVASQLGEVPLVPYSRSGGSELAEMVARAARMHCAMLLANHGAVTTGDSPLHAYLRMETVEHAARIIVLASLAGNIEKLSAAEVAALRGAHYDA